jgi:hypothetical protein
MKSPSTCMNWFCDWFMTAMKYNNTKRSRFGLCWWEIHNRYNIEQVYTTPLFNGRPFSGAHTKLWRKDGGSRDIEWQLSSNIYCAISAKYRLICVINSAVFATIVIRYWRGWTRGRFSRWRLFFKIVKTRKQEPCADSDNLKPYPKPNPILE